MTNISLYKDRIFQITIILFTIYIIAICQLPLFNTPGYEFSAAVSLFIVIFGTLIAIRTTFKRKKRPELSSLNQAIRLVALNIGVLSHFLLISGLVMTINSFFHKVCDLKTGVLFFLVIPFVSTILSASAASLFATICKTVKKASIFYLLFLFLSILHTIFNITFHPPVFAYHFLIGFFPGPIYDEQLSITSPLLFSQTLILIKALFTVMLTAAILSYKKRKTCWKSFFKLPTFEDRFIVTMIMILLLVIIITSSFSSELGFHIDRDYIQTTLGGKYETRHFTIYYEKGSIVENYINQIGDEHEFNYYLISNYLSLPKKKQKLSTYIYSNPDQKKKLMGAKNTQIADIINNEIHLNFDRTFPNKSLAHELTHIMTMPLSSIFSIRIGLLEGVAVAAGDYQTGKKDIHSWSAVLLDKKQLPRINDIIGFGFWSKSSAKSYNAAGSFVQFIIEKHGIKKFKKLYKGESFMSSYQKSLEEIEKEWHTFLREKVTISPYDRTFGEDLAKRRSIFKKVCAHKVADLESKAWQLYGNKSFEHAGDKFKQICNIAPQKSSAKLALIQTDIIQGNYNKALSNIYQLISNKNLSSQIAARAKEFKADIFWITGKYSEAIWIYKVLLDKKISFSTDRRLTIKIAALSSPSKTLREKMKLYFFPEYQNFSGQLIVLKELSVEFPEFVFSNYLIGRHLFFKKLYTLSEKYLQKILIQKQLPRTLQLEAMKTLALNAIFLKKYDKALRWLETLSTLDLSGNFQKKALYLKNFCKWKAGLS